MDEFHGHVPFSVPAPSPALFFSGRFAYTVIRVYPMAGRKARCALHTQITERQGTVVMANLRMMLGRVDDPPVVELMNRIETQSAPTLARWALQVVKERCLPVYEKAAPQDGRLRALLEDVEAHLRGELPQKELKTRLREGRALLKEVEEPASRAAARAIVTAAGVIQTPTNALGFTFYATAAAAYDQLGLQAGRAEYDAFALRELERYAAALRAVQVPDEPNPVRVNWNC